MNNIATYTENLPDNLQDLNSFILVGREKLTAVRAEIRAIEKLELAEEVRKQKRDEARMLSEALLDAEVRVGELTKRIPKAPAGRPEKISNTAVTNFNNNAEVLPPQTKEQILADMGFGKMQVSRYETLADNKDLVEQVKAEARANDEIPTRGKVLELAKAREQRKQKEQPPKKLIDYSYEDIDKRHKIANYLFRIIDNLVTYEPDRDKVECLFQFSCVEDQKAFPAECDAAIKNLQTIKALFTERVNKYGYEQENP